MKNIYYGGINIPLMRKTKRIMKLTALFLSLFICTITATNSYAQKLKMTINKQNCSISEVLQTIESKSDFAFFYNDNQVDVSKHVNVNVKDASVIEVLNHIFEGTDFTYQIIDRQILLKKATVLKKQQDEKMVKGVVVDASNLPIIGANVVVKGSTNGTITDMDGKFQLNVPKGSVLVFSYIGFLNQEIKVGDKSEINIILKENLQALEEVVVVGYGVQKKANVVGSIAQINSEALENRSAPQLSNALTGQMAGVTIIQRSGRPGLSGGEIRVRGVGSFGATPSALVLIDGIPGDMNDVSSNDVESISVLKDASTAAIYGARAANGVILVTTKNGKKGKISVSYNGYLGTSQPTEFPEFVNTWEYAELINEARGQEVYTAEEIQKFKDGSDPDHYANFNMLEDVISRDGVQTGHDISLNGGDEKNKYMVSLGYLYQRGLVEKNDYSRYNARVNMINSLLPNLKLTTRLSGVYSKRNEPTTPGQEDSEGMLGVILKAVRFPGLTPSILSNGKYADGREMHGLPGAWVDSDSFFESPVFKANANLSLDYNPFEWLTLSVIGAYENTNEETKNYRSTLPLESGVIYGPSSLTQENQRTEYKTFQAIANLEKTFGKHQIGLLAGYSWEDKSYHNLKGSRDNFPGNDLPYINAGSPGNQKVNGTAWDWALQSYFGRVKYNYNERYLFESTFRYDGSSRFPQDNKFGFFPSMAAGWRLSEESFMKENEKLSWISGLKLKASWGKLGNQNISNYPYQTMYELGQDYPYGDVVYQGAAVTVATDPTIKWEETETYDFGFESVLWNGLLSFNMSYFKRQTYDILYKPSSSVSSVLGLQVSQMNTGELENEGWEFELGHNNKIGDFSYNINANFSIINNKVKSLGAGNVTQLNGMVGNGSDLFIDYPMQMYYGYLTDGVFLTDDEVSSWVDQTKVNPSSQAGDIRYKDISGPDGVPDGKVDPNYDRTYLGSRIPKYTFGFNIGLQYKNFDFSTLIQGVSGVKGYMNGFAGFALANQGNIQRWQADGRFSETNQVRYPDYPRIQDLGNSTPPNYQKSDFWVLDAHYVRVKTAQIGYTLPKDLLEKCHLGNVRFYLQAENPLTFKSYRKGWDPEINTNGSYYPILRTYTFGVNLKF